MRRRLGAAACAGILAALCCAAPMLRADDELAEGKILVADRDLTDPNFAATVIVLITYDEQGSVGLVLNRQSETPVIKILAGVKEAVGRKDLAFEGGPLEAKSVLALARSSENLEGTRHILGDVYAIVSADPLKKALTADDGSHNLRFYLGYAGWGPGQLEAEVDAGAWQILNGDAKTIFDATPDTLWDRLMRRTTLRFAANTRKSVKGIRVLGFVNR